MSDELTTRADGLVEFAYRADHGLPWHGLGQQIPEADYFDVPAWTRASGMDWQVSREPVRYGEGDAQRVMPSHHVLHRSDTRAPLGIVSKGYQVVHPGQVLEFFRDIAKVGSLELSAAGTIYGGQRFWATAKIGEASPVSVRDVINGFVLLSTSADGSLATEARRTGTRVVCRNTMQIARGDVASVRISHRSVFDPKQVKAFMGLNTAAWDAFKSLLAALAHKSMPVPQGEHVIAQLLAKSTEQAQTDKARETAGFAKIMALFQGDAIGSDMDGVQGTAYGLLNAVTEYADRHVRAQTDQNRLVSAQWGAGNDLKNRVMDLLTA